MADQTITHSSEAQIRSVIDSWAQAMRAKDAAGVATHWDRDLVRFDFAPPLRTVGNDPQGLKDWFASWRGQIDFAITELRVTASEDVAFCHALVHLTGSRTDGSESDVWFRDTLGLRKAGGVWKIAHGASPCPCTWTEVSGRRSILSPNHTLARSAGPAPEPQAHIQERCGPSVLRQLRPRRLSTGSRAARRPGRLIARPCRRAG
jgi:ketosteroid isomerase-like protein